MPPEIEIKGFNISGPPQPADVLTLAVNRLAGIFEEAFKPRIARGKVTGRLVTALDMRGMAGRMTVEVWVKSSGAADFVIEGSVDGINWRLIDTISLEGAGEKHEGYVNAYPVIRVRTDAAGQNETEVCASR